MKKQSLYFHTETGDVKNVTEDEAKLLVGYRKIEFTKNDQGERVMRFQFNGATVDVSENKKKKKK